MIAIVLMSAAEAGASAPAPTSMSQMASMLVSLLVVLAVAVGLAWFWKRVMPQNLLNQSGLNVVASRHLGSRERLLLVQVGARYLLLGVTPHSIQSLAEFSQDELPQALTAVKKEPQQLWQLWRNKQS